MSAKVMQVKTGPYDEERRLIFISNAIANEDSLSKATYHDAVRQTEHKVVRVEEMIETGNDAAFDESIRVLITYKPFEYTDHLLYRALLSLVRLLDGPLNETWFRLNQQVKALDQRLQSWHKAYTNIVQAAVRLVPNAPNLHMRCSTLDALLSVVYTCHREPVKYSMRRKLALYVCKVKTLQYASYAKAVKRMTAAQAAEYCHMTPENRISSLVFHGKHDNKRHSRYAIYFIPFCYFLLAPLTRTTEQQQDAFARIDKSRILGLDPLERQELFRLIP